MRRMTSYFSRLLTAVAAIGLLLPLGFSPATLALNFYYPNTTILFSDQTNTMYALSQDGSSLTNLGSGISPDFSPDGSQIMYDDINQSPLSQCDGGDAIFVRNDDGSHVTNLTPNVCQASAPQWSPDGTKISFSNFDTTAHKYYFTVMNSDGTNQRKLGVATDTPEWSPDSTKLYYSKLGELYSINIDGTGETDLGIAGFTPKWSPDGTHIAYLDANNPQSTIDIMNADLSNQHALYTNTADDNGPFSWSPDSTKLLVIHSRSVQVISATNGSDLGTIYQHYVGGGAITYANWGYPYHAQTSPAVTSAASAAGAVLAPLNFTITTSGFPVPDISETGSLPIGVTLSDNGNGTAQLSGTPAAGTAGSYPITIIADNGDGNPGSQSFTLTVNPTSAPGITSAASDTETAGQAFSFTVTTNGFPYPTLTRKGKVPSGVTFTDNGNGTATLAGTPAASAEGVFPVTFTAKNSQGMATQSFTLTMLRKPVIKTTTVPTATEGQPYSFTFTTKGYTVPTVGIGGSGIADGLTFVDNGDGTGTISGTPTMGQSGGTYPFTIIATNQSGTTTKNFKLNVNGAPWIFGTTNFGFPPGQRVNVAVAPTGYPNVTCTETGTLPTGISFDSASCSFKGKAVASQLGQSFPLSITATNAYGSYTGDFYASVNNPQ